MSRLTVVNCPSQDLAITNKVFGSQETLQMIGTPYVQIENGLVYLFAAHPGLETGTIALNTVQRRNLRVSSGDSLEVAAFGRRPEECLASNMIIDIQFFTMKKGKEETLDAARISERVKGMLGGQIFTVGQRFVLSYIDTNYALTVISATEEATGEDAQVGLLDAGTGLIFETPSGSGVKITNQKTTANKLFRTKEFNFESIGIGGLDSQFDEIFRRAFASRVYPPHVIEKLGIRHIKGMLLFGPPGTGKTLIARQIGKMLNAREPKVVNGPEVLNKYVGASEENVRKLFAEAEEEYQAKGDESELHIIIFDEIDAICKSRGSSRDGTGVHDTLVNQLLTKIDGVDALNNVLLIGMTNRRDMLDEAMLRPGRMEVQIEIGLPDEKGRVQILKIHTSKMQTNSFLGRDVDLAKLAEMTKNFSGAEIEGLVKSASSFALNRHVDVNDLSAPIDEENLKVEMTDFEHAMDEVKPAFGVESDALERHKLQGIIPHGPEFEHMIKTCKTLVDQVKNSEKTPMVTMLLEGAAGSGKTAVAASLGLESDAPFIKLISAENMVGYSEGSKISYMVKVFDDAYKSPFSIVILDDIERILEYVSIGPRFSNPVLQALLVLLKKQPPLGRRLMCIGTTSLAGVMESMELTNVFNVTLNVPNLNGQGVKTVLEHIKAVSVEELDAATNLLDDTNGGGLPVKKLLLLVEMARQRSNEQVVPFSYLVECMQDLAL
ncbi:N-ethylmaleimide sensitive fusion protein [Chloropicon primus]|uniref:Vesicle-fusing ATPase n=1 Tax=Chloropicon primus TaxID=1764295 RepID=A0A5B8MW56_9CHLO|nr:N-ethylmaleimide sensitive fusion protein [Chloropicon primus]UPR02965.1 N-ethylmaleimide sensitive fusion protein [Chloropicon primus]|eukprot:QDZ23752.1 N-ethylmaleimide sensitive fusion protein [Chloropicon primus]